MSTTTKPSTKRTVRPTWQKYLIAAGVLIVGVLVMSVLRLITGENDLFSSGTIRATMIAAVPIALAGLGGLWSERAGVVNIGLEGMLILGTFGAGYFGYFYGPWQGVIGAMVLGGIGGLIHALATVTFGVDHIVSGVALNIIAAGAVQYLAVLSFVGVPGGGQTQSPQLPPIPSISIDPLANALRDIEKQGTFFVSDLASLARVLVWNFSYLTIITLLLFVATWWILWHTSFGLRLRSVGENPAAAESLGVDVYRYKFIAVTMSGVLAGLGGGFLAMVAASAFRDGQTGGRGYIGLAAMIFGNWRPGGLLAGSALFGYTDSLRLRGGGALVHGLLLIVALFLILLAIWQWRQHGRRSALIAAVLGVFVAGWFFLTESIAEELAGTTPYVTTLLVLAMFSQQLRMPAADGKPYRKGSVE